MSITNKYYFHDLIRKYTIAFGSLFENIQVVRYNSDGTEESRERIICNQAPKEKYFARTEQDPELNRNVSFKSPRMAYELVDMKYDPERRGAALNVLRNGTGANVDGTVKASYYPVPYNLTFELYIQTKNIIDGNQIVEQILPFFGPDWNIKINPVTGLCVFLNLPVTLNDISWVDTFEGPYVDRREIMWTLRFTMKVYFFGPVTDRPVIKETIISYNTDTPNGPILEYTINGVPYVDGKTIDQIGSNDDYTYVETITEN